MRYALIFLGFIMMLGGFLAAGAGRKRGTPSGIIVFCIGVVLMLVGAIGD